MWKEVARFSPTNLLSETKKMSGTISQLSIFRIFSLLILLFLVWDKPVFPQSKKKLPQRQNRLLKKNLRKKLSMQIGEIQN